GEPARVFGTSSGAIVAVHLLTAHPERIARVVAHEPPLVEVLPDAAEHRALIARVKQTFRTQGLMPAMAVFAAGLKKDSDTTEPGTQIRLPPQAAARAEQTMANLPYFVGRIVPVFMSYSPDIHRLAALSDRLVLACGEDSRGELPYRPAAFLAERLGTELQHFPGGHTGLTTHPAEFGELLLKIVRASVRIERDAVRGRLRRSGVEVRRSRDMKHSSLSETGGMTAVHSTAMDREPEGPRPGAPERPAK
ncbi:alpha/beta hydrolase, partial [Streptomyces sp. TRM76130]|nr:alpha/beta hydrolase [Streptomyces sp. TRM76130]